MDSSYCRTGLAAAYALVNWSPPGSPKAAATGGGAPGRRPRRLLPSCSGSTSA
eukprot:SAG22_NODE_3914_length_1469_cov_1.076642_1_plen_52_part_10